MANELLGLDRWVFTRLVETEDVFTGVGRRVFSDFAPEIDPATNLAPEYPLIVYSVLSSPDIVGTGGNRMATRAMLLAQVIGEGGGYGGIQFIADAMDESLQGAARETVEIEGQSYEILSCLRVNPIKRAEIERPGGIRYNYLGGTYRLFIRAA